ncbi:unnamed protein product, partial [Oppiella nova]
YGRRLPLTAAMLGGGIACLLTIPFMTSAVVWPRVTLAMVGKFCVTCSFGIIYVYSAEIYPTVVRNVGVGSSSMVGRMGSILAPFVKELVLHIYFLTAILFVNAFIYYGLSLNTNNLGGNPFINFLMAGAVEFPAYALCIYLLKKYGRRLPLTAAMLGGGIACLLTIPFMTSAVVWPRVTLAMVGKFCVTCSFGIIYVYSAEIYPTVVRNVGVGSSSMVGRMGSILAPFVKELGIYTHVTVPLAIFGILSVTDGLLILFLPETNGKEIPDTIDDVERSKSDTNTSSCVMSLNSSMDGSYGAEGERDLKSMGTSI